MTAAITFNSSNLAATATNIQNALVNAGFNGVTVSATSSGNPFTFNVTFGGATAGLVEPSIQYVAAGTPLPVTFAEIGTPAAPFTGVRLLINPAVSEEQQLTFASTAGTAISGTFELQLGSVVTGAISFDSTNLAGTATNIQSALLNAGFAGASVVSVAPSSLQPAIFNFTVTFAAGHDEPPIQYVATATPLPVNFTQNAVGSDPYTQSANVNYTNPQSTPAVAMNIYGNFVIVWAGGGVDVSYFNDIYMQRYDQYGNPISNPVMVNNELTDIDFNPNVVMGSDGNVVVTWTQTTNPAYLVDQNPIGSVYVRGFSSHSAPLWNEMLVTANGGLSTIAMDGQDNFTVAWQQDTDKDVNGQTSQGVYASEYQLENSYRARGAGRRDVAPRMRSASIAPARTPDRRPLGRLTRRRATWAWTSTATCIRPTRATGRMFRTT